MEFLGENYLLSNETGKLLYERVKTLPILDPHNHGNIKEIVENKGWTDIWEVEGATDHYVWELMRKKGIAEDEITGNASNKEKWRTLSKVFPKFAGNPTYEWIHLDLKRVFNIHETISAYTAEKIWEETSYKLKEANMKPQRLLKNMNIEIISTTNDPVCDLNYHMRAKKEIQGIKILPTWRPDKAMNIEQTGWRQYIKELEKVTGKETKNLKGFLDAIEKTHDKFDKFGCVASDHGIFEPISFYTEENNIKKIYEKALLDKNLTKEEVKKFKSYMLYQFGKMNEKSNWVMQLHIGALRNYRKKLYKNLGPDSGGDISTNNIDIAKDLYYFLNEFDNKLKIVLYVLDPSHLPTIATIARSFPNVSLGSAWWFNDSPFGMELHLKYIATVDLLSNFAGMVTDSRKLISYGSRTEMFRRTLCNITGEMVEKGQIPFKEASDLVADVSYFRPLNLFFEKSKNNINTLTK